MRLNIGFNNVAALLAVADIKLHNSPAAAVVGYLLQGAFCPCFIAVVVNDHQKTIAG
ncbi:hypothetical protein SRABI106_04557 [Rahnella aquatilis]|nr:hypothetical protein SRABI106_04557 [Rahnella aquatilis]